MRAQYLAGREAAAPQLGGVTHEPQACRNAAQSNEGAVHAPCIRQLEFAIGLLFDLPRNLHG